MAQFLPGDTDKSVLVKLVDEVTGLAKINLEFDSAGGTAQFIRIGDVPVDITLATLSAIDAAHSDGGFHKVDDVKSKGLYRLDLPDTALALGKEFVGVSIEFDGVKEESLEVTLGSLSKFSNGAVYFDSLDGVAGQDYPIGEHFKPGNNIADVAQIAKDNNIPIIYIRGVVPANVATGTNLVSKTLIGIGGDVGEPKATFNINDSGTRNMTHTELVNINVSGAQGSNSGQARIFRDCTFNFNCVLRLEKDRFYNCDQSVENSNLVWTVGTSGTEGIFFSNCYFSDFQVTQADAFQGENMRFVGCRGWIKINFTTVLNSGIKNELAVINHSGKIQIIEYDNNLSLQDCDGIIQFDATINDNVHTFTIDGGRYNKIDNSPANITVTENKIDSDVVIDTIDSKIGAPSNLGTGADLASNNDDMAGTTFNAATDSLEEIHDDLAIVDTNVDGVVAGVVLVLADTAVIRPETNKIALADAGAGVTGSIAEEVQLRALDSTVAKDATVSKESTAAKDATVSKEATAAKDATVAKEATLNSKIPTNLSFTGVNLNSHTIAQDDLGLTANQKLDVNVEADAALVDYDGGQGVAKEDTLLGMEMNTRFKATVPSWVLIPTAAENVYKICANLYDSAGNMEDPDSVDGAPQIGLDLDLADGTDKNAFVFDDFALTTPATVSTTFTGHVKMVKDTGTGRFFTFVKIPSTETPHQFKFGFQYQEGGTDLFHNRTTISVDTAPGTTILADNATNKDIIAESLKERDVSATAEVSGSIYKDINDNVDANETKIDALQVDSTAILADTAAIEPLVSTNLDATISGVNTNIDANETKIDAVKGDTAAIKLSTDNLPADPASETNVDANETKIDAVKADTAAILIDTAAMQPTIAANLDATISSVNTNVDANETKIDAVKVDTAAIKLKTDNLPGDPASETNVDANETKIDALQSDLTAVKSSTDNLPADPASETNVNANETKIDAVKGDTAAIKLKTDDLAFTGGNVHSHTQVQEDLNLTANQKLDVNAEVDTALDEGITELPVGVPPKNPSLRQSSMFPYMRRRNKLTEDGTDEKVRNDNGDVVAKAATTEAAGTYTHEKFVSG